MQLVLNNHSLRVPNIVQLHRLNAPVGYSRACPLNLLLSLKSEIHNPLILHTGLTERERES